MAKDLLNILKCLCDENRLRMLCLLRKKPLFVCEIESILKMNQSNVSKHLAKLKDNEIINSEKESQFVKYIINEEIIKKYPFINDIIEEALKFEKCKKDMEILNSIKSSGIFICKTKK